MCVFNVVMSWHISQHLYTVLELTSLTNMYKVIFGCITPLHITLLAEQNTELLLFPECQSSSWPAPARVHCLVTNTLLNCKVLC